MNEDEYKEKVSEFIRDNKEFVFNNFNDSDFGTPQQQSSNIPNNSTNFNGPNNNNNTIGQTNYANMYQTNNNVIPTNNNLFTNQSSQLMMGSSHNSNNNTQSTWTSTWTNNMNHHISLNNTQNHSVATQPSSSMNNYSNMDNSMINSQHHSQHHNHPTGNSFSWGMQSSMNQPNQQNPLNSTNTMNINPNNSGFNNMSSSSHINTQVQLPQTNQQVLSESGDVCMGDVYSSTPQPIQQQPTQQHTSFQSSPQPALSSLRRPQLLKANSNSSITFSNCTNTESNHFQTGTLSTCSSSSSLSDLVANMSAIDLDNDSNNSGSGMLRRTTSSFSRPPLKKASSLTAVAQQTAKGIQKKKEQVLSVSTVQSLVSSSLSSSPQQQEMHMPVPQQQPPTPYSSISRPMFVKSKSHGQIQLQNKLPSLTQVFGEKFFEETRPNNQC